MPLVRRFRDGAIRTRPRDARVEAPDDRPYLLRLAGVPPPCGKVVAAAQADGSRRRRRSSHVDAGEPSNALLIPSGSRGRCRAVVRRRARRDDVPRRRLRRRNNAQLLPRAVGGGRRPGFSRQLPGQCLERGGGELPSPTATSSLVPLPFTRTLRAACAPSVAGRPSACKAAVKCRGRGTRPEQHRCVRLFVDGPGREGIRAARTELGATVQARRRAVRLGGPAGRDGPRCRRSPSCRTKCAYRAGLVPNPPSTRLVSLERGDEKSADLQERYAPSHICTHRTAVVPSGTSNVGGDNAA